MFSPIPNLQKCGFMTETIYIKCAEIFRTAADLSSLPEYGHLTNAEILVTPLAAFKIDSLTSLEFIMEVENQLGVELDEEEVNGCNTVAEVAMLAVAALRA
jgi:acyl carrier protein